ncbi:hypothetical protein ABVT39_008543 [Epinephelus coioides]
MSWSKARVFLNLSTSEGGATGKTAVTAAIHVEKYIQKRAGEEEHTYRTDLNTRRTQALTGLVALLHLLSHGHVYRSLPFIWMFHKVGVKEGDLCQPTYVYPQEVKMLMRSVFSKDICDYPDPCHNRVVYITVEDLHKIDIN